MNIQRVFATPAIDDLLKSAYTMYVLAHYKI